MGIHCFPENLKSINYSVSRKFLDHLPNLSKSSSILILDLSVTNFQICHNQKHLKSDTLENCQRKPFLWWMECLKWILKIGLLPLSVWLILTSMVLENLTLKNLSKAKWNKSETLVKAEVLWEAILTTVEKPIMVQSS